MGCDIYTFVEWRTPEGEWQQVDAEKELFGWRSYNTFGWLADVRNYSAVPFIAAGRGLPADVSDTVRAEYEEWGLDAHSASWVSLEELAKFDYDQPVEDRRVSGVIKEGIAAGIRTGAYTAEPGGGEMTTYREFLGTGFFDDMAVLARIGKDGPTRLVFWFDN
jgi:hypothetical protein